MGMDRRLKSNVDLAPANCPRCDSLNTKFCYYNNYSLTQPRYFCKTCRRYWTKGGSLRNVPIGGGCQKNSRGKRVTILTNHVSTRSSSYGGAPPGLAGSRLPPSEPVGSLNQSEGNSMVSSTEMTMVNPSTIDLALVYAKLLNHQPDSDPCLVMPEFPREFHASFDISSIVEPNHDSHVQLLQEHGLSGCQAPSDESKETQLSEVHQVLLDEFGMNHKQQELIPQFISLDTNGYRLQPFPTEEVVKDMFWSSPGRLNFGWQATQLQRFEPVPEYHSTLYSNSSSGTWSALDLPSFEAFSMP